MYVLTKEEGGRHTPFYNGYRPQFYLRTTDVTGAIELHGGAEMVMPGDNVEMTVELITPIALETASASPSAKAATPWVPAPSPRSWSSRAVAKADENRPVIQLACTECRERTYTTEKNKKNDPDRIELRQVLSALTDVIPSTARPSSGGHSQGCSSIGRALVSKTSGCRFESYRPCHS